MNDIEATRMREREDHTARTITLTVVISCAVIALACVAAITIVTAAFFLNAPW